ncbi:hypothetical protein BZM27_16080 [Paraburkholderia steynii]|uniref:HTH lysR-type domain-containing protein n=1 Tax=Paraburkholderia steynii TaxID=1245441 RepID=A0A4R0XCC8_9BURK|nr:hypothetical protein BZM27_16080 [Paraburkholderia steynii]
MVDLLHLRRARLDLLPVLYALLECGSVTKAARSLDLTQSAVSQNLRVLRAIFNDDLLVPAGRSFQLTELAGNLLEPLSCLLEDAGQLVSPRVPFDPREEGAHIVISSADYVVSLLASRVIRVSGDEAPKVTFEFTEGSRTTCLDDLSKIDFFIAPRVYGESFGKRIGKLSLWRDQIVCIGARDNARLPARIRVAEVAQHRQVGYRVNPMIPEKIRRLIHPHLVLDTKKVCIAPTFSVLGEIVEKSDCIALVPGSVARDMASYRRIKIIELDEVESRFEICAFWSLSVANKRGHAWARKLIASVSKEISVG